MVYLTILLEADITQRPVTKWLNHYKRCGRKWSKPNLRFQYYPSVCLKGLTENTTNLSQGRRSPVAFNKESLEYEKEENSNDSIATLGEITASNFDSSNTDWLKRILCPD
jgi:hypothetical protein